MNKNIISKYWWRDKLIEAFENFWWKAKNKDLKKYFIDNYSEIIFKSIKKESLNGSINWQLQYYSKLDWWNNYKNKYDLFYKKNKWFWCLKSDYKKELWITTSINNKFNNNIKKIKFFLVYLFLFKWSLILFSKIWATTNTILYLWIVVFFVFQYVFYLLLIQRIRKINVSKFYLLWIYSIFISSIVINFNIPYFFIFSIATWLISFITAVILSLKNETQLIIKGTKLKDSIIFITFFVLFFISLISSVSYIGYKQYAIDRNNQNITYKQKSPEILLENYNIKEDNDLFNYLAWKTKIFYSNNYDKSNWLNFKFEYPKSWIIEEWKRPHVVSTIWWNMDVDWNKISMVLLINDNIDNVKNNDLVYNINNNIIEEIKWYKYLESWIVTIEQQPFIWNFYEIDWWWDRNWISLEWNFLMYQTIYDNKILSFQFAWIWKKKDSIKNKFYSNIRLFTSIMNSVIFIDKYNVIWESNQDIISNNNNNNNNNNNIDIKNLIIDYIPNWTFLREYKKIPWKDEYVWIYIDNYKINELIKEEKKPYLDCFWQVEWQSIIWDYYVFLYRDWNILDSKQVPLWFRSEYWLKNNLDIPQLRFSYYNTNINNNKFFWWDIKLDDNNMYLLEKTNLINLKDYNWDWNKNEFYLVDHWDSSCWHNNYIIIWIDNNNVLFYWIKNMEWKISYWWDNFIPDEKWEVVNWNWCWDHWSNISIQNYYKFNFNSNLYEIVDTKTSYCWDY